MKFLDYLYLLRPTLFFPGITIYLYGARENNSFSIISIFVIILLLSTVYLTNQLYDIETDRINNKLYFLPRGIISIRSAKIFNLMICTIMVFLLLFYTNCIFLFIIIFAFIIMNILYNIPLFNWKGKPLQSALSSFLGGSLGYLAGLYSIPNNFSSISIINSLPYAVCILSGALMTMIPDMEGDKRENKKTIPILIGSSNTLLMVLFINLINIAISVTLNTEEVLVVSIISSSIALYGYIRKQYKNTINIKISILSLSLLICFDYPLYLGIIIIYYILTRLYYHKRFNIIYP